GSDRVEFLLFFAAEDGIRDRNVTGVLTCALPIYCGAKSGGILGRKIILIQIPLPLFESHCLPIRPFPSVCSSAMTIVPCCAPSKASSCAILCVEVTVSLCTIRLPSQFVFNPHEIVFSLTLFG